ncbi:MAG: hypothetical protein V1761_01720 [bacterium]
MLLNSIFLFGSIIDTIEEFVGPYISQGLDLFTGLDVWLQAVAVLVVAIFLLVGIFVFIKKSFKLIIVIAILGGIGYLLYSQGILDNLLGGLLNTTTAGSIVQSIRALPL